MWRKQTRFKIEFHISGPDSILNFRVPISFSPNPTRHPSWTPHLSVDLLETLWKDVCIPHKEARGEVKSVFNTLTSQQIWPLNISQSKRHWGDIKCKRPQQELTNLKFSQFNIHAWLVERYSCFVFVYLFVYLYFTPWPINNSCDLWKFLSSTLLNSRLAGWLAGCWNISTFQNICRHHQQECLNWFKLVLETSFNKPPKILIPWLTDCVCYEIFFYGFKHHVSRGLSARRTIRTKSSLGSSGRSP